MPNFDWTEVDRALDRRDYLYQLKSDPTLKASHISYKMEIWDARRNIEERWRPAIFKFLPILNVLYRDWKEMDNHHLQTFKKEAKDRYLIGC